MRFGAQAQAEARQAQLQRQHDSAVHIMAEALLELYPEAQLANKHANREGFVYEVALEQALSPADLAAIEQRMAQIIARDMPCLRAYWSCQKALNYFRVHGQPYIVAQLEQERSEEAQQQIYALPYPQLCGSWPNDEWPEDVLIYQHGDFVDLCAGQHVEHMGEIGMCRLVRAESVDNSKELQRIYGVVEQPR